MFYQVRALVLRADNSLHI